MMTPAEQAVTNVVDNYGLTGVLKVIIDLYGSLSLSQAISNAHWDNRNTPKNLPTREDYIYHTPEMT